MLLLYSNLLLLTLLPRIQMHPLIYETAYFLDWPSSFVYKCMHQIIRGKVHAQYANHMEYNNKRGPGMICTQQNSNIVLNWPSNMVSEETSNSKQLNKVSFVWYSLILLLSKFFIMGFKTCLTYCSMHLYTKHDKFLDHLKVTYFVSLRCMHLSFSYVYKCMHLNAG